MVLQTFNVHNTLTETVWFVTFCGVASKIDKEFEWASVGFGICAGTLSYAEGESHSCDPYMTPHWILITRNLYLLINSAHQLYVL